MILSVKNRKKIIFLRFGYSLGRNEIWLEYKTLFSRFAKAWKIILNVKNRKTRVLPGSGITCVEMTFSKDMMQT